MTIQRPFYNWRPHPWHGLQTGSDPPGRVNAYIEITPFDLVKYEIDKITGYLRVDRPQRTSSLPPTLYGFIPRTYCGRRVGELSGEAVIGDGDPLDICVISERPIERVDVILAAKVVGGVQTIDRDKADDKIVAVLENDSFWGGADDLSDLPKVLVDRLQHYFGTYKMLTGEAPPVKIKRSYGRDHAWRVVQAAIEDYSEECRS
jgi:inorganic pyrophosphatase